MSRQATTTTTVYNPKATPGSAPVVPATEAQPPARGTTHEVITQASPDVPTDLDELCDQLWDLKFEAKQRNAIIRIFSDVLKKRLLRRNPENRTVITARGRKFRLSEATRREISLSKLEKAALTDAKARKLLQDLAPYIKVRTELRLTDNLP